ncbi:MAG: ABC transporter permease [Planctomycetota bacterium]|jgi:putative ABC transport system permease protein
MDSIQIWGLIIGYGLLIVPFSILLWAKVPVMGRVAIAVIRMTLQLLFVGLYLQVVFNMNKPWLNGLWVLVMIVVADFSILRNSGLQFRKLGLPLFISLLIGTAVPLLYFVGAILWQQNVLEAKFVIPIGGMILGNCLRSDVIGLRKFFQAIRSGEKAFNQQLADGATLAEATKPYLTEALHEATAPTVATMATIGLVSLPGMMTGVILGGADPRVAVMYQIAIMIAIFTGMTLTILLAILLCRKTSFNDYGILNRDIFK